MNLVCPNSAWHGECSPSQPHHSTVPACFIVVSKFLRLPKCFSTVLLNNLKHEVERLVIFHGRATFLTSHATFLQKRNSSCNNKRTLPGTLFSRSNFLCLGFPFLRQARLHIFGDVTCSSLTMGAVGDCFTVAPSLGSRCCEFTSAKQKAKG